MFSQHSGVEPPPEPPEFVDNQEEFLGPFSSWYNVKTDYGAVGDGVTDDTAAIQAGLDDIGTSGHSSVLYLPAGTYRVTSILVLTGVKGVTLVGEDPATTTLLWDGIGADEEGSVMLWLQRVAYSQIRRLTFDGNHDLDICVWQAVDTDQLPHFDTGNEYADCVFQNSGRGINGGSEGFGFAETTVQRCTFRQCSDSGISMKNFNALDLWVWHCVFDTCDRGVTNEPGAGDFKIYGCLFKNSGTADIHIGNTGQFSARHCLSIDSERFLLAGFTANFCTFSLQENTILDPIQSACIDVSNHGPLILLDNTIRSRSGATAPIVHHSHGDGSSYYHGNTFTVSSPITRPTHSSEFDTSVVARSTLLSLDETDLVLPPTPPQKVPGVDRALFEPTAMTGAAIQAAIDAATISGDPRPIVHLPYGTYAVNATITIPAGSHIQFVGDGHQEEGSRLLWGSGTTGPMLQLSGPTKVTIRDVMVDANTLVAAVQASGIDQVDSHVLSHRMVVTHGIQNHLLVDELDHTLVEMCDWTSAYHGPTYNGRKTIAIVGGTLADAGTPGAGQTIMHAGGMTQNPIVIEITQGARCIARDLYYEHGGKAAFSLGDKGTLTLDNWKLHLDVINDTPPAVVVDGFDGQFTMLGIWLRDRLVVTGDGSNTEVLALCVTGTDQSTDPISEWYSDTSDPAADARRLRCRKWTDQDPGGAGSLQMTDVGTINETFLETMLAHTRSIGLPSLTNRAAGITDLRLYSVAVTRATIALHLAHTDPGSPEEPPLLGPSDNFDDNTRNTELWDEYLFGTAATVAETNQQLECTPPSLTSGVHYAGYISAQSIDMTGGMSLIEVIQVTGDNNAAETGYEWFIDLNNTLGFRKTETTLYCFYKSGGSFQAVASPTYDSNAHRWWRLRHVAANDTIRWDVSEDGISWNQLASESRPLTITAIKHACYAGTWEEVETPGMAIFDRANITP